MTSRRTPILARSRDARFRRRRSVGRSGRKSRRLRWEAGRRVVNIVFESGRIKLERLGGYTLPLSQTMSNRMVVKFDVN
jgi:hypothetical protein